MKLRKITTAWGVLYHLKSLNCEGELLGITVALSNIEYYEYRQYGASRLLEARRRLREAAGI